MKTLLMLVIFMTLLLGGSVFVGSALAFEPVKGTTWEALVGDQIYSYTFGSCDGFSPCVDKWHTEGNELWFGNFLVGLLTMDGEILVDGYGNTYVRVEDCD